MSFTMAEAELTYCFAKECSYIMREVTACFTGHRPEKLPDGGASDSQMIKTLKSLLHQEITAAVNDGYTSFITGMARGVDLWAGEMIVEMICSGKPLKLTAVFPYRNYESRYKGYEKWVGGRIISKAAQVVYLNEQYYRGCMRERNEYMVDRSSRLIAVVGDYKSGSGQTVKYARSQQLDVHIIDINNIFPDGNSQLTLL